MSVISFDDSSLLYTVQSEILPSNTNVPFVRLLILKSAVLIVVADKLSVPTSGVSRTLSIYIFTPEAASEPS